jgi:Asp-tRNA(Asn)/Glu-tRNA(Gln) amidotransferase A subunit family amidase
METIAGARAAIAARELSAVELLDAVLDRVRDLDATLRAYILVDEDGARAAARAADAATRSGDRRPLLGIPICVKDVIDVAGLPTTAGAAGWRRDPAADAPAAARLRAAGAVIVGKGNTNEFAYGADGRNPHWGDARNPHDPERLAGGSSSGPAVAVAAGMALGGLGTDTSGSVRIPAALCGIAALRPTLGAIPTDGVVPLAWSYDAVGPMARTVEDVALLWRALGRADGATASPRVGLLVDLVEACEPGVADATRAVAERLGATPVEIPLLHHAAEIHAIIQMAEASAAHHPWFAREQERYSPVVRDRLERGRDIAADDYLRARQARRDLAEQVRATMDRERLTALLAPTVPAVAPPLDGDIVAQRRLLLRATVPLTQTGGPVMAVPVVTAGLPVGVQLAGRPGDDAALLDLARRVTMPRDDQ